VWALT